MASEGRDRWTRSGVGLRCVSRGEERWNWLFVPGRPDLGSESGVRTGTDTCSRRAEYGVAGRSASVAELEGKVAGLCLVSSAPHAGWRQAFGKWAEARPIHGLDEVAAAYARDPSDESSRRLTLAAAEWNFTPDGLAAGPAVLDDLPHCQDAVAWADAHFDDIYQARGNLGAASPQR